MKTVILTLFTIFSIAFQPFGQTSLIKDINQVPSGSMPFSLSMRSFESINSKTICFTQTNLPEFNLISIDSTNHTTTTILSFDYIYQEKVKFIKYNGYLYFFVNARSSGKGLWKTDGTIAGTTEILGNVGITSELIVFQGFLYFIRGNAIWKSDGTTAGTTLLASNDFVINNTGQSLIGFNNNLIFRTSNQEIYYLSKLNLQNLSITTIIQTPGNNGFDAPSITASIDVDTALYLLDKRLNLSYLWKIGSSNFQAKLIDTYNTNPQGLYKVNNHIIFSTNNKLLSISSNSNLLPTVLQDTIATLPYVNKTSNFAAILNNQLYIIASGTHSGYKLWKSDGTINGTVVIKDLPTSPTAIFFMNNSLYFKLLGINKLWKSDGTEEHTIMAVDLPLANLDSLFLFETQFWVTNNKAFFWGSTLQYGAEPYFTDGNSITELVSDIEHGTKSSFPLSMTCKINGILYFVADDGIRGKELWKSDGTPENTILVKDIAEGSTSSYIDNMTEMNGILYFTASDVIHGTQLWRSDGTSQGTYIVKIISSISNYPGPLPSNLTVFKGNLYFSAKDDTNNSDLWKSDGTEVGTIKFTQSLSSVSNIFTTHERLFFVSKGNYFEQVLWTSDGSVRGTYSLKDLPFNSEGMQIFNPTCFASIGNKVYFLAPYKPVSIHDVSREALFVSDGTENGTKIVRDFGVFIGGRDSLALSVTNSLLLNSANNRLFFRVRSLNRDSTYSYEYHLWTSDGTPLGTKLLNSNTKSLLGYYKITNTSTNIYYIFNPSITDLHAELWATDGITNTKLKDFTYLFRESYNLVLFNDSLYLNYSPDVNLKYNILKIGGQSIQTYFESMQPISNLLEMDGNFYFTSYEPVTGYELWKLQTCNYVTSKQSGYWNAPETWLCNRVPNANDTVLIKPTHAIEVSKGIRRIKKLILRGNINLQTNALFQFP